jgi:hypothetical protein
MKDFQFSLIIISLILSIIILIWLSKLRKPKSIEKEADNTLQIKIISHPYKFQADPNNPLNEQIVTAINRMGGTGSNAEENYQKSITQLLPNVENVVKIITKEYWDLAEEQYLDRWALVQLLIELKNSASLQFFDELLQSKIPPERFKDPSFNSSVGEEVMIRTTAVEGLVRMGKEQNSDAIGLLLKYIRHENYSVKRSCIQGYQECGGRNAKEELLKLLGEKDKLILSIKREDVRNIPQPKVERSKPKTNKNDKPGMPPPFN